MALVSIAAPLDPVYRVGRAPDPLEPPPIGSSKDNRFDDPGRLGYISSGGPLANTQYSTLYLASQQAGAYGETISRYRSSLPLIADLAQIVDDEPPPENLQGGILPHAWRLTRRL